MEYDFAAIAAIVITWLIFVIITVVFKTLADWLHYREKIGFIPYALLNGVAGIALLVAMTIAWNFDTFKVEKLENGKERACFAHVCQEVEKPR